MFQQAPLAVVKGIFKGFSLLDDASSRFFVELVAHKILRQHEVSMLVTEA